LNAYRVIAAEARRLVAPGGIVVVELGLGQLAPVRSLFAALGLPTTARNDLAGTPRALLAGPLS